MVIWKALPSVIGAPYQLVTTEIGSLHRAAVPEWLCCVFFFAHALGEQAAAICYSVAEGGKAKLCPCLMLERDMQENKIVSFILE